jgi:crossover junction endodeoxyribonuclease RuvC
VTILGVDPGSAVTGYGVVRRVGGAPLALVECGVIRTDASQPLATRLRDIHDGVRDVLSRHSPDCVVIEDIFFGRNPRSTAVLGHARGVILLAAAQASCEIVELSPARIKKAVTGAGAATKEQVQYMVAQLLRLARPPQPADAADGVAAALAVALGGRPLASAAMGRT